MPERSGSEPVAAESAAQRRRRLDAVFGDVLPETTRDDQPDRTDRPDEAGTDAWLRAQVPPHHGG